MAGRRVDKKYDTIDNLDRDADGQKHAPMQSGRDERPIDNKTDR